MRGEGPTGGEARQDAMARKAVEMALLRVYSRSHSGRISLASPFFDVSMMGRV